MSRDIDMADVTVSLATMTKPSLPAPGIQVAETAPGLLSVRDVAATFGRTERTIRRWISRGELTALRVGRSIFIRSDDVCRLISDGIAEIAANNARRLNSGPEIASALEEKHSL